MAGRQTGGVVRRFVVWSRYFIVIAVVGLFAAFMALMVSSAWNTFAVIVKAVADEELSQKELVGKLVQQADTALLATVLYVIALGLYSLFVDDGIPMPGWLRIRTLGDLKELLASVVIVVLAVIFLGYALMWDGVQDLLVPGISCSAVIAALALFLWVSGTERARLLRHEIDEEELTRRRESGAKLPEE